MSQTIAQKLRIKPGMRLIILNAPANFSQQLQPLLSNVIISPTEKIFDQIHWFVTSQAQLNKEVEKVVKMITENVTCWTYYPKITSAIKTDLTRDKGWEALLKHDELKWLSMIAFDETWTAFAFRLKAQGDEKKATEAKPREIFNYVDPIKKTVRLPADLGAAFEMDKEANDMFKQLSFTNKKEYVEWVITAKREETRKQRITGTIERLLKGWKNPANL